MNSSTPVERGRPDLRQSKQVTYVKKYPKVSSMKLSRTVRDQNPQDATEKKGSTTPILLKKMVLWKRQIKINMKEYLQFLKTLRGL